MSLNLLLHLIAAGILFSFINFCALIIFTAVPEKTTRTGKNKRKKHQGKDNDYNNNYQNLQTIMHDFYDSNSHNPS